MCGAEAAPSSAELLCCALLQLHCRRLADRALQLTGDVQLHHHGREGVKEEQEDGCAPAQPATWKALLSSSLFLPTATPLISASSSAALPRSPRLAALMCRVRGETAAARGQLDEAVVWLERAVTFNPGQQKFTARLPLACAVADLT